MEAIVRRLATPISLDFVERGAILIFYALVFDRIWPSASAGVLASSLILISEGTVVFFVLIRRPAKIISGRLGDWMLGLIGTAAPLLIVPHPDPLIPAMAAGLMMGAGIIFQVVAKLFLNRSFGVVAADRGIKVGGPYRLIRHPIYLGYIVTQIGFLLVHPTWWNLAVYTVSISFNIARLIAEEKVLGRDKDYRAYAARVPYRLIPRVF